MSLENEQSGPTTPAPGPSQTDAGQTLEHRSPWSRGHNAKKALWWLVRATLFRWSPHNAYAWRRWLLRHFGAEVGPGAKIRPTARIELPWNLSIGSTSSIGDHAIIYNLGQVTIGEHTTISQYAHLCAGTHELDTRRMKLICPPITLGDDVWIAADAFVGPGVSVGSRTVLGARSSAFKDLPPDVIAVGSPAKPIGPRQLKDIQTHE